ncbi:Uncharacterised protein [Vibrio cholerae]|nr:Uncharacterised protein [Vibrio cholerae]
MFVHGFQHLHFRIRAGVSLKISEVFFGAFDLPRPIFQLRLNTLLLSIFIGKRRHITESAAATAYRAIAIRTTESTMQR